MNKKSIMTTLAAAAMLLLPVSCADDYDDSALWDKVNNHEERLATLEKWQEQTNQSIAGMQQLLNTADFITDVTSVTEGGETVGYTITFANSDPITIYNGAKDADGEDDQDSQATPQIGLAQDEDGNWYWTLNGQQMTDTDGNPVRANGQDGVSAPTPQISLGSSITAGSVQTDNGTPIADAWYLSVDDGKTWYRVSGTDGTNDDAWFAKAPEKDGNCYVFTLTGGSTLRVAAYQPLRILTEDENTSGATAFENAMVPVIGTQTFHLDIGEDMDYAEITVAITDRDLVLTRAAASDWTVAKGAGKQTLTVTPGIQAFAQLDVCLLLKDGGKLTASRLLGNGFNIITGENGSPTYHVYNEKGLKAWAAEAQSDPTLNCSLEADITLTPPDDPTQGSNWTPVGNGSQPHTGNFDGNGHTLSGLTFRGEGSYLGLFGNTEGTVQNLKMADVKIDGGEYCNIIGAVAGNSTGDIINCSATAVEIKGESYIGGIAGSSFGAVTNCHAMGSVSGTMYFIGGIVGQSLSGSITACSFIGDVTATDASRVGGISGTGNVAITACFHVGTISGDTGIGGVAGESKASVTACYHVGNVTATGISGGVVGYLQSGGSSIACWWSGNSPANGIGSPAGDGGTTQVTGDDWSAALAAMNAALEGTGWEYYAPETPGVAPLLLRKKAE